MYLKGCRKSFGRRRKKSAAPGLSNGFFPLHYFILWAELFFQVHFKHLCKLYENVQGIWVVCLTLIFASVKKSWPLRHTNQIICQEKREKLRFWKMKLKVRSEYSDKTSCFTICLDTRYIWLFLPMFKIPGNFHDLSSNLADPRSIWTHLYMQRFWHSSKEHSQQLNAFI